MNCHHFVELMSEYVDKEMDSSDLELWEKHFSDCPPCADFFKSFKTSVDLTEHLKVEKCPQEIARRLEKLLVDKANKKCQEQEAK